MELWAQFKNPEGDIHDHNNYIQGPCDQPEWGTGYRHPDYWNGWRQVPIDYVPPTPPKSQEEQLTELDAEFNQQFDALTLAWATASMDGDTTTANARFADKTALRAEYTKKREAILNA